MLKIFNPLGDNSETLKTKAWSISIEMRQSDGSKPYDFEVAPKPAEPLVPHVVFSKRSLAYYFFKTQHVEAFSLDNLALYSEGDKVLTNVSRQGARKALTWAVEQPAFSQPKPSKQTNYFTPKAA